MALIQRFGGACGSGRLPRDAGEFWFMRDGGPTSYRLDGRCSLKENFSKEHPHVVKEKVCGTHPRTLSEPRRSLLRLTAFHA
ncbi:unnamed protein product [Darwinula stevensoni]|uniref:Uncharacterized protein n=1 Tax=Darwinula stevensoni TaxID=69355 RepID=A0A7R9A8K5_9CRUS|nr:unnamed protein product [Darwinula stevensoni]CAG0896536.1 unnamed protein product [Darwinula stevensoni]